LSFFITLDENSNILKYELLPSIIKVDRHFSYDEVNNLLDKEQALQTMFELALRFRAWRLDRGGMVISLPELVFSFEEGNLVDIRQQKADQPSRILVAEFMIMANYLAAKFMEEKGIAAIYRSQPPPRGRVMNGISNDIFILYLQRKLLNSSKFDIKPTFHHILGLQGYSSVTSPLRRYLDLVMQRQIVFFLQKGKPLYTKDELSHLIPYFDQIISRTNMISAQQVRYWVLHYLEQYIKNIVEAYILEETPRGYRLLLRDYLMEANLIDPKARFAQGEKVKVKIKVVNPHKDILKVTLQ
jgi:exoribonuclease-2